MEKYDLQQATGRAMPFFLPETSLSAKYNGLLLGKKTLKKGTNQERT